MKHPSSQSVYKVVETLESVLPLATREDHLDMQCVDVNADYTCGTIHCHGGWYAIASKLHEKGMVAYFDGVYQMAKDLGFEYSAELEIWVEENPTIWGNEFGDRMFGNRSAFFHPTKRPNGAETLKDIVDHWKEVADKLEKLEAKEKQPEYMDITNKIAVLPIEEMSDVIKKKELI